MSGVQENPYPGYPNAPRADAIDTMRRKLEEICTANPPDAERITRVWRALTEYEKPQANVPGRFRGTRD